MDCSWPGTAPDSSSQSSMHSHVDTERQGKTSVCKKRSIIVSDFVKNKFYKRQFATNKQLNIAENFIGVSLGYVEEDKIIFLIRYFIRK